MTLFKNLKDLHHVILSDKLKTELTNLVNFQKPKIILSGLAKKLVLDQLMSPDAALEAMASAQKQKIPFVTFLVEKNLVSSPVIAASASTEFGVPLMDLNSILPEMLPLELIPEKLIRQHHALPLYKRGNRLYVALSDPTNLQALDEFKFHTGIHTDAILVEENKLKTRIEELLNQNPISNNLRDIDEKDLESLDISSSDQLPDEGVSVDTDDAPIVRFVNKVLLDAIYSGASDVHFEPYEKIYRIRFRQDGILREVSAPPINLSAKLAARLKVMARLDISERRVPQDGRFKMKISASRAIDFRVNSCPTLFGEKVVLRILDPASAKLGIDALGYSESQKALFLSAIHRPQGMVLVTGPTGSGKTVSLYTALNILNTPERNISTAEDPVEINLAGINQVNVNPKAGLTFSSALKAFLRQDPDVIMVGEIRDLETGEIAVKAAQTGHMVLSTLHTNSAPETLTRLMNMGIAPFNLATSIQLIIAQRLARKLCPECKVPTTFPAEALLAEGFTPEDLKAPLTIFTPKGCATCNRGYKGRVGIYQVMPISENIARLILKGANAIDIADQAHAEGHDDLRRSGLKKIALGLTSLEEINRVTHD